MSTPSLGSPTSLPGSLPSASVAAPDVPPPAFPTPIQMARAAAEARSRLPPAGPPVSSSMDAHRSGSAEEFNPSVADKLPFHRLLDSELLPKCSKPQAVKTLEVLITMTSNILEPPNPAAAAKFRTVRLTNPMVQRNIVDTNGAFDYLVACGFRRTTVEFVPYLTFASSPTAKLLHQLKTGRFVLLGVVEKARAAEEREKRFRDSEHDAESVRVRNTMLGFEEDRRLKREKDERERIVRDAKAAKAKELAQQATLEAQETAEENAHVDLLSGPRSASRTMDVDQDLEGLPTYGELHGRVLGSGESVVFRGARLVAPQDEEDSGEDDD